jgi:hypothetical protein
MWVLTFSISGDSPFAAILRYFDVMSFKTKKGEMPSKMILDGKKLDDSSMNISSSFTRYPTEVKEKGDL